MNATEVSASPTTVSTWTRRVARSAGRAVYRAPGELTLCPACGSQALAALALHKLPTALSGRRTGLVSGCEDCGLVFVNPSPSEDALASMYAPSGEWALGRLDEAPPVTTMRGTGQWRKLFEAIRGELDVTHPPPASRVLDFGCGRGKFLDVLKPCGWVTYGIEPATDIAFKEHQRLDAIPAEPTFDLVIAHHVLEHVSDPLALLTQFAAAVRPRGYLFVAVPRLDTLPAHRDLRYVVSRVHVRSYTSTCMNGLLRRAGWQPVHAPSDEVTISGGRRTSARLRILAQRVDSEPRLPHRPLEPARRALKTYYGQVPSPSLVDRLVAAGCVRIAARATESQRRLRKTLKFARALAQRALSRQ